VYEYNDRRNALSGLGWSELTAWDRFFLNTRLCSPHGSENRRRLCFVEDDVLDERTATQAGCIRTTEGCTTASDNRGLVWCCPQDRPGTPVPMTPEQREREEQRVQVQQQAEDEGRITSTDEPPPKTPPEEPEPPSQSPYAGVQKLFMTPASWAAMLTLGLGGYYAYRYYRLRNR